SKCNNGPIQCCQNTQSSSDPQASQLLALLGLNIQDVNVPIGITCSPITGIGAGSAGCSAAPVCCENNDFQGLIAIGCVPISIGL
ncbi:hydrophobin, partial [Pterulicium gracile]